MDGYTTNRLIAQLEDVIRDVRAHSLSNRGAIANKLEFSAFALATHLRDNIDEKPGLLGL